MNLIEKLKKSISKLDFLDDKSRLEAINSLNHLELQKINLLITGATGVGKSSTINSVFNTKAKKYKEVAKVGVGVEPETPDIVKYELNNLTLWDSPGLGDGLEQDKKHSNNIIEKLREKDENGDPLIDLVLVVLDGRHRDLGTSYDLINRVIIPNIGENPEKRIIVAINQADQAMNGLHWNYKKNRPKKVLSKFLDDKALSVSKRILEATGIEIQPIYYSAGNKSRKKQKPYNLSKLLCHIVLHTPKKKRLTYLDGNISNKKKSWSNNDNNEDYGKKTRETFVEALTDSIRKGMELVEKISSNVGLDKVRIIAGGVIEGTKSMFKRFFS